MKNILTILCMLIFLPGCIENPLLETCTGLSDVIDNIEVCIFENSIIETGFSCPNPFSQQFSTDTHVICSKGALSQENIDALDERLNPELLPECGAIVCEIGEVCLNGSCEAACVPTAELCGDRIDNDCDGLVDCDDDSCKNVDACSPLCLAEPLSGADYCGMLSLPTRTCIGNMLTSYDCNEETCGCDLNCDILPIEESCLDTGAECADGQCTPIDALEQIVELTMGDFMLLAVSGQGQLFGWGHGLLTTEFPQQWGAFTGVLSTETGYCVDTSGGGIRCFNQQGLPKKFGQNDVAETIPASALDQIVVSDLNLCIKGTAGITCTGKNDVGQLGRGTFTESESAHADPLPNYVLKTNQQVLVPRSGSVEGTLVSGLQTICALDENSDVYCWGASGNDGKAFASQLYWDQAETEPVNASYLWAGIGSTHICALTSKNGNKGVYCWPSLHPGTGGDMLVGDWSDDNHSVEVLDYFIGLHFGTGFCVFERVDNAETRMVCGGALPSVIDETRGSPSEELVYRDGQAYGAVLKGYQQGEKIVVGHRAVCWLRSDGRIACWGASNNLGRRVGDHRALTQPHLVGATFVE